jgi:carboxylate-amine ligase
VLPLLLAVSANSPYLDGQDSGLHSARTVSFTRLFPRCGIPEPFGDWATFADYIDFLQRTESIVEYTQVWWSVRPHTSFGTVEVRICDAQSSAVESEALAALVTACVRQAARDEGEGRPGADVPGRLIEENLWRAMRWGLDGKLLDLDTARPYPAPEVVERLAEWTAPARVDHGIELGSLVPNGAQRQRRLIEAGVGMEEVFVGTTRETRETYAAQVTV